MANTQKTSTKHKKRLSREMTKARKLRRQQKWESKHPSPNCRRLRRWPSHAANQKRLAIMYDRPLNVENLTE